MQQDCKAIVLNDDINKPMWTEMSDQRQECLSIKFNKEVQVISLDEKTWDTYRRICQSSIATKSIVKHLNTDEIHILALGQETSMIVPETKLTIQICIARLKLRNSSFPFLCFLFFQY